MTVFVVGVTSIVHVIILFFLIQKSLIRWPHEQSFLLSTFKSKFDIMPCDFPLQIHEKKKKKRKNPEEADAHADEPTPAATERVSFFVLPSSLFPTAQLISVQFRCLSLFLKSEKISAAISLNPARFPRVLFRCAVLRFKTPTHRSFSHESPPTAPVAAVSLWTSLVDVPLTLDCGFHVVVAVAAAAGWRWRGRRAREEPRHTPGSRDAGCVRIETKNDIIGNDDRRVSL